jgi:hypothetical protein
MFTPGEDNHKEYQTPEDEKSGGLFPPHPQRPGSLALKRARRRAATGQARTGPLCGMADLQNDHFSS